MKYIINNKFLFDFNDLGLSDSKHPEIVTKLKKPVGRLLLEFLHNSKVDVSREYLLEKVWSTNMFTASNAGLNNYVSDLRKAFTLVGCEDDIIITLPKFGFRFEADVASVGLSEDHSDETNLSDDAEPSEPDEKIQPKKPFLPKAIKFLLIASGIMVIIIFLWMMLRKDEVHRIEKIGHVGQCDIYSMSKLYINDETVSYIKKTLDHEGFDCTKRQLDVFYIEDRINRKTVRADLVSVCARNPDQHYNFCFNVKNQWGSVK
ncbi:winged helix-turn-helix domain-containing protein [Erwinia persicina]|uniref:winged helix-turn-helix domain-containing protein n=1 Tax=Erwinia persicina TaxID=55211 RepID=UPI00177DB7FA|nr:winged helix-turn-helix domain-containing protein [Erwinia persicina]MBD8163993.1 winged helix-turn-helix domain-containing protein [Erwinia persicina]MBD8215316.1 winged helix-turn-helix domain-containing protein [Erwinia persicina]